MDKLFTCQNFPPLSGTTCTFSVQGEENYVIQKAVDHLVSEHGLEDTPQLHEDVKASLTDVPI